MKETNDNELLINLIVKELAKEASEEEISSLSQLRTEPENEKIYQSLAKTYELTQQAKGITEQEVEKEWQRLDKAIDTPETGPNKNQTWFRIAAALILAISATLVILQFTNRSHEIIANELIEHQLPDRSSITLKEGSMISFRSDFNEEKREILFDGEGFFDITRDQKPFIISTGELNIQVLGTSFNVNSLHDRVEVVLVEGKVSMQASGTAIALQPGEKGIFDKQTERLFKVYNDNPNFQSWRTKVFSFDNTPLSEVVNLINAAYAQTVFIQQTTAGNCPVTANFEQLPFDQVVQILSSILDLEPKKDQDKVILEGMGCQ